MEFLKNNKLEKEYFNYSNFGIWGSNLVLGLKEGEIKIQYKAELNIILSLGKINNKLILSFNFKRNVYWKYNKW